MITIKDKLKQGLEKRIYNEDEFIDEVVNFQKEIILNRLREEYRTIESGSKANKQLRQTKYFAMRSLCLDCSLITFNEIELMEFEVNESLSS